MSLIELLSGYKDTIVALTALIAVVTTPFITFIINRRQINSQQLLTKQNINQEWINGLREKLTEFYYQSSKVYRRNASNVNNSYLQLSDDDIRRYNLCISDFCFYLNLGNKEHEQLYGIITEMSAFANDPMCDKYKKIDFQALTGDLIKCSQKVIKNSWSNL